MVRKPGSIQTVGKDYLEKRFEIKSAPQMFVGTTKHYSWPKGAAIAGIGSGQIIDVPVDNQARMDIVKLRGMLENALSQQRAIYSVVAIVGSTEQGAVDPLFDVLELRQEFEKRGLSFVVHCDGAWGGYFAACIRDPADDPLHKLGTMKGTPEYVPQLTISPYTRKQLENLGRADSITIDPHKSGYCPYPAGGLCYRDGRMRYLVTWTSPIVYRGESSESGKLESIGVYGVEGSKPGAAAVGAWLSQRVIGLHWDGYGTLLGEAILTCTRLYCHWATMNPVAIDIDPQRLPGVKGRLTVTPFTMLPAERDGESKEDVEKQKQFIRDRIIGKDNATVFEDEGAVALLAQLGGDLQINAFACNFEIDGELNKDVVEANYFNSRIFTRTSVTQPNQNLRDYPLYLTSTQFAQSAYQACLDTYKRRMGVEGPQDLYTLVNVTMGPWSTSYDFVQELADKFKQIAEEEMKAAVRRNVQTPDFHRFVVQGSDGDRICGVHLPMFNMQNHRWQLIISYKLPEEARKKLLELKKQDPSNFFTFVNLKANELPKLIADGASFEARLDKALPGRGQEPIENVIISDVKVLYKRSMQHQYLSPTYPDGMIFYGYAAQRGTDGKAVFNIDKLLNTSPDIQLNADTITFKTDKQQEAEELVKDSGCWFRLTNVHESALQPLLQKPRDSKTEYINPGFKFVPGAQFTFEALVAKGNNPPEPDDKAVFTGTLKLGSSVFADYVMVNADAGTDHHDQTEGKAKQALEGLPTANTSALVAEYPNDLTTLELRNSYQQAKMQDFAAHFAQAGVMEARKVVQEYDGKNAAAPNWAVEWANEGAGGDL